MILAGPVRLATLRFFRVCINLTNSCSNYCEYLDKDSILSIALARLVTSDPQKYCDGEVVENSTSDRHSPSSVNDDQGRKEFQFEILLLSLGLLINFVQESTEVKDKILASSVATDIKNLFENLMTRKVFILSVYTDFEESANHALGYLALLLAHLMIPSVHGRALGVNLGTRHWVERLLDDFVNIHRVVQSQSQEEVERKEVEGMAGEVERVLTVLRSQ